MNRHDDSSSENVERLKLYLEYLEKEMSIMGLLSTFCALVVGGGITLAAGLPKEHESWLKSLLASDGPGLLIGLALVLCAALFFYRQRSWLAWCYGQLTLTVQTYNVTGSNTKEWLAFADSWSTWRFYRFAFCCLCAGVLELALVTSHQLPNFPPWIKYWHIAQTAVPPTFTLCFCLFVSVAFSQFPESSTPYKSLIQRMFRVKEKF